MVMMGLAITSGVKAQNNAAMKAWQAYMTPGEVHQMIAKSDGNWKAEGFIFFPKT